MSAEKRVMEWELGLPSLDEITPLSQCMIPPQMASAFNIKPEPCRTHAEVHRASLDTLASVQPNIKHTILGDDQMGPSVEEEEDGEDGSESSGKSQPAAARKRRLVWTPQLHKRFIDVVAHLGLKKAVPKTIMQLMNVEGLTRENVASHLQKYRLYLKRKQEPSSFDHFFAFKPVPQNLLESSEQSNRQVNKTSAVLPLIAAKPVPQPQSLSTKHLMLPPQSLPDPRTKHVMLPPQSLLEPKTKHVMLPPQSLPLPESRSNVSMPQMMPMMGLGHEHGHMGMPSFIVNPSYQGFESYHWSLEKFTTSHHHHATSNEK